MNHTIWKFELDFGPGDVSIVISPKGARVVSAGIQGRTFVIWAVVDPAAPKVARRFVVHGTGHPVSEETAAAAYVGVVFIGPLVFHVFDLGEVA